MEHCQCPKTFSDDISITLKVFGVQWGSAEDYFTYSVSPVNVEFTKRSILSHVARIYDPLGWLSPFILLAKLLLQNLWRVGVPWDEIIPANLCDDWVSFVSDLSSIKSIKIPRKTVIDLAATHQLIGFCDGSTKAYGCCVYLRSSIDDQKQVSLLISKSKVVYIKPLTVNRLELCGALLLSRTLKHMQTFLISKINISHIVAYTDRSTVLAWINTEPYKLKPFVAHRVVKITDAFEPSTWRHVSTQDNPAEFPSRGISCAELVNCKRWWSGPDWMLSSPDHWPAQSRCKPQDELPELKTRTLIAQSRESDKDIMKVLLNRYSPLSRLQRELAWVFCFISDSRKEPSQREKGHLTTNEVKCSLLSLIKYVQWGSFNQEMSQLKS
ncbi:unnamed protein product [Parnassius mnemosyne]|uniref:Uncharacterized protein n=1 Tax=Parnassius mnemosyne TaxID=213953 RepID=A0AAV1KFB4_9NEOP